MLVESKLGLSHFSIQVKVFSLVYMFADIVNVML